MEYEARLVGSSNGHLAASKPEARRRTLLYAAGMALGMGAGVGAALAGYAFLKEPFDVRLEEMEIYIERGKSRLPQQGLRILHLSDLHFRGSDQRERTKIARVRKTVADLSVDLIIHTGDFLHHDGGLENVLALIDVLPTPTLGHYAVLGNHDYAVYDMSTCLTYTWQNFLARERRRYGTLPPDQQPSRRLRLQQVGRFVRHLLHNQIDGERTGRNDVGLLGFELEKKGVTLLHNRSVHLNSRPDLDIYLAGIDDLGEGEPNLAKALEDVPAEAPLILLSHNPDILDTPAVSQADLVLAGHTHGGQIVLPLVGAAHTQTEHLSRREASGHFRRGSTQVYVHRGLGEGIPLRLGAPPHLSLIHVRGR